MSDTPFKLIYKDCAELLNAKTKGEEGEILVKSLSYTGLANAYAKLFETIGRLEDSNKELKTANIALKQERDRYKEALEYYANQNNWCESADPYGNPTKIENELVDDINGYELAKTALQTNDGE